MNADQQRLDGLEASIAQVLLRLSALDVGRPQGLRSPVFTAGQVDRLLSAANRIRALGEGVALNERATDLAIEIARHSDGSVLDRKSVVSGKSVSVRVDLGGRRFIKKKKT